MKAMAHQSGLCVSMTKLPTTSPGRCLARQRNRLERHALRGGRVRPPLVSPMMLPLCARLTHSSVVQSLVTKDKGDGRS